jgi:hypothetical protein
MFIYNEIVVFNIDIAILSYGQTEGETWRGNQYVVSFLAEGRDSAVKST